MDRDKIISTLCGNKINTANFQSCEGQLSNKCEKDMYCVLQHLSNDQVAYILSDIDNNIFLNACPGSGKTEVIGVKCAYEMKKWKGLICGVAILTFTNSAENELRERVASYYRKQLGYPHFLGTFTSWIHGYIANPFLYCVTGHGCNHNNDCKIQIIDSDCNSNFLNAFKTKYSYGNLHKVAANEYYFNAKEKQFQYCGKTKKGKADFGFALNKIKYMSDDLWTTKRKFWKAGFFLYEDVEVLTYKLLKEHPEITTLIAKRFPVIIVDECQDLSYIQLLIIKVLQEHGTHIHLIGDLNQAIYGFRDIEPKDTLKFITKNHLREMVLSENYRSNQSIVDISGKIIRQTNSIYGQIAQSVSDPLIAFLYTQNEEGLMIKKYYTILERENLQLENCRIIVRNDTLRTKIRGAKSISPYATINIIEDYAYFVYSKKNKSVREFQKGIQLLSRAIQNSFFANSQHDNMINLFRPSEIEVSDWSEIILLFQKVLMSDIQVRDLEKEWQSWKKALSECLAGLSHPLLETFDLKRLRNGIKDNSVISTFENAKSSIDNKNLSVETIHGCKGMSLDSVLFISAYKQSSRASGSYWTEWFPDKEQDICESHRLAYVAFSRARHFLALGIPKPKSVPISKDKIGRLKTMGFRIFDCELDTWV